MILGIASSKIFVCVDMLVRTHTKNYGQWTAKIGSNLISAAFQRFFRDLAAYCAFCHLDFSERGDMRAKLHSAFVTNSSTRGHLGHFASRNASSVQGRFHDLDSESERSRKGHEKNLEMVAKNEKRKCHFGRNCCWQGPLSLCHQHFPRARCAHFTRKRRKCAWQS